MQMLNKCQSTIDHPDYLKMYKILATKAKLTNEIPRLPQVDQQRVLIEDVERHGPRSGPPSASSSNFVFYQPNFPPNFFGFRQTDRRNKYVLGLPCFKKLISE